VIGGIHHFGLTVRDVEVSAAWYAEVLGFRRVAEFESPDGARRKVALLLLSWVARAGVMADPLTGEQVLAYVTYGKVKLANLRQRPQTAVTFREGWQWATVEGLAQIIGPDDPHPDVDSERLRLLLREVFTAAGGTHDNWAEYDRAMADQRRTIVLVRPTRIYGN
jgi:PPOX class probable F420-dependent enzyme